MRKKVEESSSLTYAVDAAVKWQVQQLAERAVKTFLEKHKVEEEAARDRAAFDLHYGKWA